MSTGYIYLITNKINNKKYVGQTIMTVQNRWLKHCSRAKVLDAPTGIDGAIKKYGKENFEIETILECPTDELDKWEIYYIKYYDTYQGNGKNLGYNITTGGQLGYVCNIDEDEMLQMYSNGKTIVELADYYNCSIRTISNRLKKYNVDTKQHQINWLKENPEVWKNNLEKGKKFKTGDGAKPVRIIELDKTFNSLAECSQWLLDNNYTKAKTMDAVRKSLSRHLNGDRESYLKMHFEYI